MMDLVFEFNVSPCNRRETKVSASENESPPGWKAESASADFHELRRGIHPPPRQLPSLLSADNTL